MPTQVLTQERLDSMVAAGALIQVLKYRVPVLDIATATVIALPEGGYELRHCCMFPNDGHDAHTLPFDSIEANERSLILLEDGECIAGIAPYEDWPELDVGEYLVRRQRWLLLMSDPAAAKRYGTFFKEA